MSRRRVAPTVLFRVAAGPRVGFGHLVRAVSLADALGVRPLLSIRGGHQARVAACRLGATTVPGVSASRVIAANRPDLLVVDDRVAGRTAAWRRAARDAAIPIVSVHDLGIGLGDADLVVDGSLSRSGGTDAKALFGPRYAILRPALTRLHAGDAVRQRPTAASRPLEVLVALGGGPRWSAAMRIAARIADRWPACRVSVAGGFVNGTVGPAVEKRIRQVLPSGFDRALARADVAVTGGGVTLYESCCLGVAPVAVAVVPSQRPTVEDVAARGAAIDGGLLSLRVSHNAIALAVGRLLADARLRGKIARRGRQLVDGRGAARVASAVKALLESPAGRRAR